MQEIEEMISFADELAELSRAIILSHPFSNTSHEIKDDGSPVTPVDREVEQRLRERIDASYPGHGVIGEEFANHNTGAERVWIIDPIDGTKQYLTGIPLYGTLIAFTEGHRIAFGVLDFPATGDRWIGGRGHPTRWNGKFVTARPCASLGQAVIAPGDPSGSLAEEHVGWSRLSEAGYFRVWGSGCYSMAMLASGKLDVAMDTDLDPYDFAAPAAVVEGAGGVATDWQGQPLSPDYQGHVLFLGDPNLLDSVLPLLKDLD